MSEPTTITFSLTTDLKEKILNYCDLESLNFSKKTRQLWEDFLSEKLTEDKGAA